MLVVDRVNNLDTLEIQVEMTDAFFSDSVREIETLEKKIAHEMQSTLSIAPTVHLLEPGTLPRFEGKAARVIDKRVK